MLTDLVVQYGYLMVVAGVIVEGDATVVAAAFLSHRGYLKLSMVIALAAITSMTMNQIYFRLGRRHGVEHVAKADGRKLFRNIVHHTRKHAIWLLLLSRFVFGFRMAIPATVGALGMSTPRFMIADFAGSIIWAVTMGATGYAAGHVGQLLIGNEWEVGFVLMALTLGWGVYRRRHVQQVTTLIDRTDELVGHPGGDEKLEVDETRVLDDEGPAERLE
jgi:membrane protein DedA with SNARE-associated domain